MTNYNVVCKVFRGGTGGDIEAKIQNYLGTVDTTKVIRAIQIARYGSDQLIVMIIHDS